MVATQPTPEYILLVDRNRIRATGSLHIRTSAPPKRACDAHQCPSVRSPLHVCNQKMHQRHLQGARRQQLVHTLKKRLFCSTLPEDFSFSRTLKMQCPPRH